MTAAQACEHPWIKHETIRTSHDLGEDLRQTLSRHIEDGGGTRYGSRRPLNPSEQELYTDSSASEVSSEASSISGSEGSMTSHGSDTSVGLPYYATLSAVLTLCSRYPARSQYFAQWQTIGCRGIGSLLNQSIQMELLV